MKSKSTVCLLTFFSVFTLISQNNLEYKLYLDSSKSNIERLNDLMSRMTLEDKVYQMNQFVGLDHMRKAEKNLSPEDLLNNDAQGFYKGVFSSDVMKMTEEGKIGSFLHVLTAEESNLLQELSQKSRLKIPILIGIDAIHGNALFKGATVYPSPITLASTWNDQYLFDVGRQTALEMRATGSHWAFTPNIDVLRETYISLGVGFTFNDDEWFVKRKYN